MTDFMYVDIIVDTTKIMTAKVIGIYFCGYYRYRQTAISELCSYMYKKTTTNYRCFLFDNISWI